MLKATFKLEKETKNTYKFQEKTLPGKPPVCGTLYLQKYIFKQPPQSDVVLTIETPDLAEQQ